MKILYQGNDNRELSAISTFFNVYKYRTLCNYDFIIPRMITCDYVELHRDLTNLNCKIINSIEFHLWTKTFEWYNLLQKFTFQSWTDKDIEKAPQNIEYVVKGATNSNKLNFSTHMYAKDRASALAVASKLKQDLYICNQDIVYRRYLPLKEISKGYNGLVFSDEWRFFFFGKQLLCHGYYWDIAELIPNKCSEHIIDFAKSISTAVNDFIENQFYVLDIASLKNGDPILVEINDGCYSGLSCCSPIELYSNLSKIHG